MTPAPPPRGPDPRASSLPLHDDALDVHRRRFFRSALSVTPLAVLGMIAGFWALGGDREMMIFPALFAVLSFGVARLAGRSAKLDQLAYHLFGATMVLVIGGGAVAVGGGLGGPELMALPMLPLLMSFLGGQRAALLWTGVALVEVAALLALDPYLPASRFDADEMTLSHGGVLMACLVISLAVGLAYVRSTDAQAAALARSRDAAQAASAAKSTFLATMSHEIRTPLAGIVGLTDLLEASPLGQSQARELRLLRQTSDALVALIGDVLDLARIEAGRLELHPAPVDATQLLGEVVGLFSAAAERKSLALRCTAPPEPVWVVADGGRLRQVLVNLVSNAVKFTERGHVHVALDAAREAGHVTLRLAVSDSGPGIAPAQQAALFEPFVQAESTHARHHQGTGLGLAIVRELCQRMGGSVALESALGEGATFRVEVRFPEAPPAVSTTPEARRVERAPLRVLLVEDNAINQLVISELLRQRGCDVRTADGGQAALDAATADPPDLVLMDMQMPDMDGLEATRRMRRAGVRVPVVALTANTLPEDRAAAREAGMDGFLTKPLTREAMDQLVARRWPSLEDVPPTDAGDDAGAGRA